MALLHGPFGLWRTGDHGPDGLLLAAGPDIGPGPAERLRIIDIGPSVAARLGVELAGVDGRAVPWLAGPHTRHGLRGATAVAGGRP